jgi:hypothetical protein
VTRYALLVLAIAASACDDSVGPTDERRALRDNRRLFEREVGASYSYDYRNVRFAVGPIVEPVRIRVRAATIVSVVSLATGQNVPPDAWHHYETVLGLFTTIEAAYENNAAEVRVEYHRQYGYPTDVYIDRDRRIADEEAGYTLQNLTPESGVVGLHYERQR